MGLKWDGDDETDSGANEEAMPGDDELVDVTESSTQEGPERPPEMQDEIPDNPDDCQHPWDGVTQETMKRIVQGSAIDTKEIYWCNSCKTILDVIE